MNPRPSGYEPDELPAALLCYICHRALPQARWRERKVLCATMNNTGLVADSNCPLATCVFPYQVTSHISAATTTAVTTQPCTNYHHVSAVAPGFQRRCGDPRCRVAAAQWRNYSASSRAWMSSADSWPFLIMAATVAASILAAARAVGWMPRFSISALQRSRRSSALVASRPAFLVL